MKQNLNEVFILSDARPDLGIGFYHDSDGTKEWIKNEEEIDKINTDINFFLYLLKRKGDAANFAFKHKIGYKKNNDINSYKNNFDWICADAWYTSNYFYLLNVPGYQGKKVAFNLRVADHPLRPNVWFGSNNGDNKIKANQFVLNVLIDPKVNNKGFDSSDSKMALNVYNVVYDPNNPNAKFETFIDEVVSNSKPTYDYNDIKNLFGLNIRFEKFGKENIINKSNFNDKAQKPILTKVKKSWFDDSTFGDKETIVDNINGFDYTIHKPTIVDIKGTDYYQIQIDDNFYVMNSDTLEVRKRIMKNKMLTPDRLSDPIIAERKIRITEQDIKYMIMESIKQIKKRLV